MNKAFKVIWNEVTATFVAVPESAKGHGAPGGERLLERVAQVRRSAQLFFIKPLVAALICIGFTFATYAAPLTANVSAPTAVQLPTGAQVSAGAALVTQAGTVLTVKQSSSNAAVNWQSFDVGSQATVNFEQPNAQSVILNRVQSSNPSQIFGKINGNGSVFLQNPNGVYFAPGSSVDVGSFLATTHHISDADLMSGNYTFGRTGSTGKVLNQGSITSKLGGYIALLAPEVRNEGVVVARGGSIVLAAGETFQLQFEANHALTNVLVSPSTVAAYVENGNAVMAPGGLIILSAQAANAIQGGVVKNTGTIQANGLVNDGGVIKLVASHGVSNSGTITADALPTGTGSGGQILLMSDLQVPESTTHVDGTLSAQAGNSGGEGGRIETSGSHVHVAQATHITTNAPQGTGGSWIIDPTDFTVGSASGSDMTGATLGANLNANNVTILSSAGGTGTSGNVNINEAVSWSGAKKLTLSASNNININSAINVPTGGSVSLVYGTGVATGDYNFGSFGLNKTSFTGSINFAGTGAGLFTTQLGTGSVVSYAVISNPSTYVAASNATGGITSASGNFALGQNYNFDRSFTAAPITGTFSGKFEGLGHTAGNLTGTGAIGLFSNSSGLIRDVGVNMSTNSAANGTGGLVNTNSGTILNSFANASIYSAFNGGGAALSGTFGGLVGTNSGPISNSFSTGSISGTSYLGGLVGNNSSSLSASTSNIFNSFTTASVTGSSGYVGGLIGQNATTGSGLLSTVSSSFATGNVTAAGGFVGGLIGYNFAGVINSSVAVINSYATGIVTGPQSYGANYYVGGLIGQNRVGKTGANATVSGSYATGNVSAAASWVGGLVGNNQMDANGIADILSSYATGAVSNPTAASGNAVAGIGGLIGLNRSSVAGSSSKVISSYATGSVTGSLLGGSYASGGLIGYNWANASGVNNSVSNSYATGVVSGLTSVGGLVGWNQAANGSTTNIDNSYATGNVSGFGGNVGGLVGSNAAQTASVASTSKISNSYAMGNITNSGYSNVGGLVGNNASATLTNSTLISNSYATGNVSASSDYVGGLVGTNDGYGDSRILQSYATGNVASTSALGTNVGGLVGLNRAEVANSNVTISQSYSTGSVTAPKIAGGLVGLIGANSGVANIDQSYATGNVQQTAASGIAGGLVGQVGSSNAGSSTQITNSFSTGNVTGVVSNYLGGLVGNFAPAANGGIQNSYTTGAVSGSTQMGGLIGSLTTGSNLQNNYWNTSNNAGLSSVSGGVAAKLVATAGIAGLSTTEMQTLSNFSGWDTANVWQSLAYFNNQLPFLKQNNTLASIALIAGSNNYGETPILNYSITNSFGNAITTPVATGTPVWALSQGGNFIGNQSITSSTNAGVYSLTYASGIRLGNYTIMSGSATDWTVNKAPLGLSVTGTYSGTTSVVPSSYSVTGLKNGETMVPTQVTVSDANVATANKFVQAITANTGNANFANYSITSAYNATPNSTSSNSVTLNPIALTVSGVASTSGNIYFGQAYTGTYTSSAMVNADINLISVTGVATGTNAGTYPSNLSVTLSGSAQTNYSTPVIRNANFVISPKPISVTSQTTAATYDGVTTYASLAGQATFTYTDLVLGDTLGSVTQVANKSGIAQAGSYTVTPSSATLANGNPANYQFSYVSSNANVSPIALTVLNSSVASKVYDRTTQATVSNGSLQGVLAADINNVSLNQSGAFANPNVGPAVAVNLSDTLSGLASSNYTITQPTGLTAAITPKSLGVNGQIGVNKVFDASTVAVLSGGALTGVLAGDSVTLVQAGNFASPGVGTAKTISAANALTGDQAGNYQVTQPSYALTANITPAVLNVQGLAASSKVYDGTTTAVLSGNAVAQPLGGGQVTINGTPVGSYANKNVGTNKFIDVTGFTLSGADAPNYQVTGLHGVYGDITPASLSVSSAVANNKVYDATTAATLSGAVLNGLIAGDVVNVNTGTFNNKTVGTGKAVTALLTGADAGNYNATGLTGYSANIAPASLTVSGQTAANKVYDATITAVLSGGSLSGVFAGDTVSLNQAGSFNTKNASIAKPITASNTLSGAEASNYVLTQPTLSANITPATLVVSGLTAADKVYNALTDASITGQPTVNALAGDVVTFSGTASGTFADKNVGVGKAVLISGLSIDAGAADGANYVLSTDIGLTANITKRDLTVTGSSVATKVYDRSTTATITGGVLQGLQGGESLTLSQTGSFVDKNAGVGKAVTANQTIADAGTSRASNYNLIQPTGLTGTITPAPLSVTGLTVNDKLYDGTTDATFAGNPVANPLAGDDVTITGVPSAQFTTKNAGNNIPVIISNLSLTGADRTNYSASAITGVVAKINPAPLTADVADFTKVYDGTTNASPSLEITSGLIGNETLRATGSGTLNSKNVNDAIALTVNSTTLIDGDNGGLASNYVLQPGQNGNATVTPKALTASVAAPQKVYDGTALFTPTVTITAGLVGTETLGVSGTATFNSKDVAASNTLTLQAINLSDGNNGGLASNYSLDVGQNMAAKILSAPLVASLTASSKVYDGTTAATSSLRITSGLIGAETVTVNGLASFNSKDVASANVVTVNQTTLLDGINGGLATNYKLDPGQTVAAKITPAPLTASVSPANKVYNGTTAATASLSIVSGLIGSEGLNVTGNVNFNSKDVASANQLTVQSINLADGANGGLASNYSLDPGQSVASKITPAPLTASVSVPDKIYDGSVSATPIMNVLTGLMGSEKLNITAMASYNSKDVDSASKVTVNSVSLSNGSNGGLGSNYSLSAGQTVAAKITPAVLTASVSVPNKVYDGSPTTNASLNITAGLVGSETLVATGKGTFNTKDVATANLMTVQSVALEDGNNGGRAVNYSLSPGQKVAATISPASLTVTQIASASSTYAEPIKTGEATLTGLIGADKVTGVVELGDAVFSSSNNVVVGAYKQAVNALAGADASNYKVRPVTSMAANYVVNPLSLSGSIASSSSTSGASLVPGAVSLSNVVAKDAIGSAEVAVVIPGDPIGSKTGNTVGNFVGSQKIASLAGTDAANYNFTQVVGNYQVKTGFSSGAIYPREMNVSAVKPVVNKDSTLAKTPETINNERAMAQDSKTARADQPPTSQATQDVIAAPTQAKNDVAAKVLSEPDQKTLQVATLGKPGAKVTPQLRGTSPNRSPSLAQPSSLASGFAPGIAPGIAPGTTAGVAPGLASNGPSLGLPKGENTTSVEQASSLSESTQAQKTDAESSFVQDPSEPIYAAIREVLESEVTYQVVGGVTSVVVVANALLTAASKLGIANLAGSLPAKLPINIPTPSSSLINNRFGPRLTGRI